MLQNKFLYSWLQDPYFNFLNALKSGRMPGSLILSGRVSDGALDLAIECARAYLCINKQNTPCFSCKSCTVFDNYWQKRQDENFQESTIHPDIMIVRASSKDEFDKKKDTSFDLKDINYDLGDEYRAVRIDSLRKLSDFLQESAIFASGKVAIITNAHMMNENSANAILKTFEEPPKNTLIIMVSDSLDAMLPTILSRAYKITVGPIKETLALDFLVGQNVELNLAKTSLTLSHNAPLGALAIHNAELDKVAIEFVKDFSLFVKNKNNKVALCEKFLALDNSYQIMILSTFVLELLKYKAGMPLERLNLLVFAKDSMDILSRLPKEHLFIALDDLKFMDNNKQQIPIRAPFAILSAWLDAIVK